MKSHILKLLSILSHQHITSSKLLKLKLLLNSQATQKMLIQESGLKVFLVSWNLLVGHKGRSTIPPSRCGIFHYLRSKNHFVLLITGHNPKHNFHVGQPIMSFQWVKTTLKLRRFIRKKSQKLPPEATCGATCGWEPPLVCCINCMN